MPCGLVCILVFASVAAGPVTRPATAPSPAEAARQAALGEDWAASRRGIAELRKAAWQTLQKLAKNDTLTTAQVHYDKLMAWMKPLSAGYAARMTIIEVMGRRAELLAMYRKLAGPADTAFLEGDETKLAETATKVLGAGAGLRCPCRCAAQSRQECQFPVHCARSLCTETSHAR